MSTIVVKDGKKTTLLKGAPDRVLKKCTKFRNNQDEGAQELTN
jgi:magnesium-transporting ATPase (P-type)